VVQGHTLHHLAVVQAVGHIVRHQVVQGHTLRHPQVAHLTEDKPLTNVGIM